MNSSPGLGVIQQDEDSPARCDRLFLLASCVHCPKAVSISYVLTAVPWCTKRGTGIGQFRSATTAVQQKRFGGTVTAVTAAGLDGTVKPPSKWSRRPVPSRPADKFPDRRHILPYYFE